MIVTPPGTPLTLIEEPTAVPGEPPEKATLPVDEPTTGPDDPIDAVSVFIAVPAHTLSVDGEITGVEGVVL